MSITSPPTAIEGELLLQLVGVGMSLVDDVELVATSGAKEFRITQDIEAGRTSTLIQVNVGVGLAATILAPLLDNKGDPLTDSQWSVKWVVGVDELAVNISPPTTNQLRELDNTEKFGGILNGVAFGIQDQLVSLIAVAGNTIKQTRSNGKATGYFDGIGHTMDESITHYIFTASDGKWRARDEVIVSALGSGLWFDGDAWVDVEPWID